MILSSSIQSTAKEKQKSQPHSSTSLPPGTGGIQSWDDLSFWSSGEWDVVQENLGILRKQGAIINPSSENMFNALDLTPYYKTKVIIVGQDPYPDHLKATGMAFSIPRGEELPATLKMIFKEYEGDLRLPYPPHGDLTKWADQGVLLWNALPTCEHGKSLSHDWPEWRLLTQQIIEASNNKKCVLVFVGGFARQFAQYSFGNPIIEVAHPSPRAMRHAKQPFIGSRFFSTINAKLNELKLGPIDWRIR